MKFFCNFSREEKSTRVSTFKFCFLNRTFYFGIKLPETGKEILPRTLNFLRTMKELISLINKPVILFPANKQHTMYLKEI